MISDKVKVNVEVLRFLLKYTDFAAAATTKAVDLCELPEGSVVVGCALKPKVKFEGGAVSAATMAIGHSASAAALLSATDVFVAGADTTHTLGSTRIAHKLGAKWTPQAKITTTGANTDALTAGECEIFLSVERMHTPDAVRGV